MPRRRRQSVDEIERGENGMSRNAPAPREIRQNGRRRKRVPLTTARVPEHDWRAHRLRLAIDGDHGAEPRHCEIEAPVVPANQRAALAMGGQACSRASGSAALSKSRRQAGERPDGKIIVN